MYGLMLGWGFHSVRVLGLALELGVGLGLVFGSLHFGKLSVDIGSFW